MTITAHEYLSRMESLQHEVAEHGLEAFLVSSEESIYYLTGVSYRPFERPFFIVVRPEAVATFLVPTLEKDHLQQAPNVSEVQT